jgi:ketosteroid isomerase-like protein
MGELAELYQPGLDAFNRRDKAAWLQVTHPELENHPPREWPEAAVITGAGAVWDFFLEAFEMWDDGMVVELVGPVEEGEEAIIAHVRADVRGKASGAAIVWEYFQVLTYRDRLLVRMDWFTDPAEARQAAGIAAPADDNSA